MRPRNNQLENAVETESEENQEKKCDIFVATYDMQGTILSDQTGKFWHISSRGNRYQMVVHKMDSNSNWVEPIKCRTEDEVILARERVLHHMKLCGLLPKYEGLDNEA